MQITWERNPSKQIHNDNDKTSRQWNQIKNYNYNLNYGYSYNHNCVIKYLKEKLNMIIRYMDIHKYTNKILELQTKIVEIKRYTNCN